MTLRRYLGTEDLPARDLEALLEKISARCALNIVARRPDRTPWVGDPRINIQNDKGKAKPYKQDKRNEL